MRAACDMDLWEDELPPPRDELLRRVAGVDGVLTLLTDKVDDEFLGRSDLQKFRIVAINTEDPPEEFHGVFVVEPADA